MGADRENGGLWLLQVNRQWGVSAGAPQHHFAAADHADNRVIDVAHDRAIVYEEGIGDGAQTVQRFILVRAKGLIAQVAARGDDRESEFPDEQMVQGGGG